VVLLPTYNNQRTLRDVLSRVAALGLPMIVINDGCTDSTPALLADWLAERPSVKLDLRVHPANRGKAAALQTGFRAAGETGYTHALTLDTDGQHDPAEIPALLAESQQNPRALVLGYRDDTHPDYPAKSRIGRRISNFFIRLESGLRVRDSQCGMRVYPLPLVQAAPCRAGHFGYEAEIITRAAWSGCPVIETPIVTRYLPLEQRVSHFRPWLDTIRGIAMHVRLVLRAMIPLPHPKYEPQAKALTSHSSFRAALWQWLNPLRAWRELRQGTLTRSEVSAALAVGVFIGNLPAYGLQTVLALYTARRLHLHPVAVVAGSHVSIPPLAPFLIAAAIALGHLVLHGTLPPWSFDSGLKNVAGALLLDWVVGGVVLGLILAIVTFAASQILLERVTVDVPPSTG
jgi:glycosyltransferase involved in cell wall biosynthesis